MATTISDIFLAVSVSLIVVYINHAIKGLLLIKPEGGYKKWCKDLLMRRVLKPFVDEYNKPLILAIELINNRLNNLERITEKHHEMSVENERSLASVLEITLDRLNALERKNQEKGQCKTTGHENHTPDNDTARKLVLLEFQYGLLVDNMKDMKLKYKRLKQRINDQRTTVHHQNDFNRGLPYENQCGAPGGNGWTAPAGVSYAVPPSPGPNTYPAAIPTQSTPYPACPSQTSVPPVPYSSSPPTTAPSVQPYDRVPAPTAPFSPPPETPPPPPPAPAFLPPPPPPPSTLQPPSLSSENKVYKRMEITSELLKTVKLKPVKNKDPRITQ